MSDDTRPSGEDLKVSLCKDYAKAVPQSPASSILLDNSAHLPSLDFEGRTSLPTLKRKCPSSPDLVEAPYERKREKWIGKEEIEVSDEESCGEKMGSRSVVASRKLKELLKSGQFVVDEQKRKVFEEKCEGMGDGVKFRYGEKWEVLHQKCGKWYAMTEPYNTTRFKAHLENCQSKNTKGRNTCISDLFLPRAKSTNTGSTMKTTTQLTRRHDCRLLSAVVQ